MGADTGRKTIPGTGTYFVGIDIAPGRYRCDDAKGGWWVRFTGPGGADPVGSWPLPAGPVSVDIHSDDLAFETHIPTYWRLVRPTRDGDRGARPDPEPRPVADPTLRRELDIIVSRRVPLIRVSPLLTILLCLAGYMMLGPVALLVLAPAALVVFTTARFSDDMRRAQALKSRRDRYLTLEDFDAEGKDLLVRVQGAIGSVLDSRVNEEGLLDSVDNAVTLPRQEWEIAQVLARQSALRREQREFLETAPVPEVKAAMVPLREKLDLSVEAVTRRVEALERYADRARAADEAFHAHRHLEALAARAHEYDELLADTVRDELALPAIERLTEQSDQLVRTLRSRLAEAAAAATELPSVAPRTEADEKG